MRLRRMLLRQQGQVDLACSHFSMHSWWKQWSHPGSKMASASGQNSTRQIEQVLLTSACSLSSSQKGRLLARSWLSSEGCRLAFGDSRLSVISRQICRTAQSSTTTMASSRKARLTASKATTENSQIKLNSALRSEGWYFSKSLPMRQQTVRRRVSSYSWFCLLMSQRQKRASCQMPMAQMKTISRLIKFWPILLWGQWAIAKMRKTSAMKDCTMRERCYCIIELQYRPSV